MPKTYKCRSQFTAYLRSCRIPYQTHPSFVYLFHFNFLFCDEEETVLMQSVMFPRITYTVPYCCPDTLLAKFHRFRRLVTLLANQSDRPLHHIGLS